MSRLETEKYIAPPQSPVESSLLSIESLFGDSMGKMFGVLEGYDAEGKKVVLFSFSGQFNGRWRVDGWAPPLFDVDEWHAVNRPAEKEIKLLGRMIEKATAGTGRFIELKRRRKQLSRELMVQLHRLYRVGNFRGEARSLASFFPQSSGIPTGTGDCCAPKLLNLAQKMNVLPTGMAEFYWGRTNRSTSRGHARFYPPCPEKCHPLLGFMLCGLCGSRGT